MADIPNFYDPYHAENTMLSGAQQLGQIPEKQAQLAQTQASTAATQANTAKQNQLNAVPNPARPHPTAKYISALGQPGVDPIEMGKRARMEMEGHMPDGTAGLPDSHPARSFGLSYGQGPSLGGAQGSAQPGAQQPAQPEQVSDNAQPMIGGQPIANPVPEGMSYNQFQVIAPYTSHTEAAQARYWEALLKNETSRANAATKAGSVTETNTSRENIAAWKNKTTERGQDVRAKALVDVAKVRADAYLRRPDLKASMDPVTTGLLKRLQIAQTGLNSLNQIGAKQAPGGAEQAKELADEVKRLTAALDERGGGGGAPAQGGKVPQYQLPGPSEGPPVEQAPAQAAPPKPATHPDSGSKQPGTAWRPARVNGKTGWYNDMTQAFRPD